MTAMLGEILSRIVSGGPKRIAIVGVSGNAYVVTDADTHSSPFELTPDLLSELYGGSPTPVPSVDENDVRRQLRDAPNDWFTLSRERQREALANAPEQLTPEQQFERAESESKDG
jgi:hypothetical protein